MGAGPVACTRRVVINFHRFNARGGSDGGEGEGEGGAAFSRRLSSVNFVVCH